MPLTALRHQVLEYAKRMAADGLANGSQGNVSAIDRERGLIAITPSAADYATMRARDIVVIDLTGKIVKGLWKPTIETPMHLGFYLRRPEVGAVVHCHAPQASGFAAALRPIPWCWRKPPAASAARCRSRPSPHPARRDSRRRCSTSSTSATPA